MRKKIGTAMRAETWLVLAMAAIFPAAMAGACGSTEDGNASGTASSLNGSGADSSTGGIEFTTGTSTGGSTGGGPPACAQQEVEASLKIAPVDIIFVIDNSGSMTESIKSVQDNINASFAQIIGASGIDYRVILVARHGKFDSGQSVCIEAPLSGIPKGGCAAPPPKPVNTATFFHYSVEISSHNSWCQVLRTFTLADEFNLAPMGWQEWVRPEAVKLFVEITDDQVNCNLPGLDLDDKDDDLVAAVAEADEFDAALLALSPEQFGTAMKRNYRWHSIVAMANKDVNNPALAWLPSDPMTTTMCGANPAPGVGYQALSIKTNGLRFPLCATDYYKSIFEELAKGVISGQALECSFTIPDPPAGQEIDPETIIVSYTPGDGGTAIEFQQVASVADCAPEKFYIDKEQIVLCTETCDVVSLDAMGKIKVLFGCIGVRS
ncbi:MAG: VWA domain-containing protein [Myxococcales bacterium]|nr:VWA domain-containing protein [Myxococcales bacterium]